jgi:hypothetical protein
MLLMAHLGVGEPIPGGCNRYRFHILSEEKLLRFSSSERNAPQMLVRTVEERLTVHCPGDARKTL